MYVCILLPRAPLFPLSHSLPRPPFFLIVVLTPSLYALPIDIIALKDKTKVLMGLNQIQINKTNAEYPNFWPKVAQTYTINGEMLPTFTARPGGRC